jgi:hypothetical protein
MTQFMTETESVNQMLQFPKMLHKCNLSCTATLASTAKPTVSNTESLPVLACLTCHGYLNIAGKCKQALMDSQ